MILILTDFDKNIPVRVNFDRALWWRDNTPGLSPYDTQKPKRRTLIQHEKKWSGHGIFSRLFG